MKLQRIAIGLTVINLVLLVFLLAQYHRATASEVAPVLRGRMLQIEDEQGRVRAEILVHGPETVDGKTYPEAVLFRMADPKSGPVVKMTATPDGAALGLSDGSRGTVQLYSRQDKGNYVRVVNRNGSEQSIKP